MSDVFLYPVGVMGLLLLFPVPRVDALIEGTGVSLVSAMGTVTAIGDAMIAGAGSAAASAIGTSVASGAALLAAAGLSAGAALGTVTSTGDGAIGAIGGTGSITKTGSGKLALASSITDIPLFVVANGIVELPPSQTRVLRAGSIAVTGASAQIDLQRRFNATGE